jgi:DNA-binding response OmpR family regulator
MRCAPFSGMNSSNAQNWGARILIVDDDETSASVLARLIEKAGYAICITITNPVVAVERISQLDPDIVLLDLHMEPLSGIEVLAMIAARLPPELRPPVLVLTADESLEAKRDALAAGATDFLAKPLDHVEVLLRIKHLLDARSLSQRRQNYSEKLEGLVDERAAEMQKQIRDLEQASAELKEMQMQAVQQARMQAQEAIAAGIARDVHDSLSLILGYADMLLSSSGKFSDESKERACLEAIARAGREASQMIGRLGAFGHPIPATEQPVEMASPPAVRPQVSPLRVLLVDNHPGIREVVSAYLVEDRHQVETAADGKEAWEKFRRRPFDLVITDRAMPEINGDHLAALIKKSNPSEPIIMLTAFADLMTEADNRSENVDLVVSKPVCLKALRQAIENVTRRN